MASAVASREAWTLLKVVARGVLWGLPSVSREMPFWRARAAAIPDVSLREEALGAIDHKRENTAGAALYSIVPSRRDRRLLRLLVAYQIVFDFLDDLTERHLDSADTRQLHRALVEALDPQAPVSDYFEHHLCDADGGYLRALVETCQASCATLSSYVQLRPQVLTAMGRSAMQGVNHDRLPERREAALKDWAVRQERTDRSLAWFELAASAVGYVPYALLALANEDSLDGDGIARSLAAYLPWIALAMTMLDSYADMPEDAANGTHCYIGYYGDIEIAVRRLSTIIERSMDEARKLPHGDRHAILVAGIVAMYLSSGHAQTREMRARTLALARAGGPLTCMLLPVLRIWRAVYLQRGVHGQRWNASAVHWRQRASRTGSELPPGSSSPRAAQAFLLWRSPLDHLERCRERYGSRFTIRATSHPPLVMLADLADIESMLAAPPDLLDPGEGADTIEPLVGKESFILAGGREHLHGRRVILPSFRADAVQRRVESIKEVAERQVASWPVDRPFASHPRLLTLLLETALQMTFGSSELHTGSRFHLLRTKLLQMLSVSGSVVLQEPALRHGRGGRIWRRFLQARAEVDQLINAIILDRERCEDRGSDLLAVLRETRNLDGSSMSPRQIRAHVMSLIVAGHETTAAQLAWALQLLAHNPDVQAKLSEEVRAEAGEEYLTATIQEVLRHRPVFLITIPRAVKGSIEIGGQTYHPPARLAGCIYLVHHDRTLYPEPQVFQPERFVGVSPASGIWLPWGGGRKRCPGHRLAMLEMKIVLRTVLATLAVRPADERMERPRWRSVIVTPHRGSRLILEPRRRGSRRLSSPSDVHIK
jgi:cytochrome P450